MLCLKWRGLAAAQNDVESKTKRPFGLRDLQIKSRNQPLPGLFNGYLLINRVVGQKWVAGEIHLSDQARNECGSEERKMNVRRTPCIVVVFPRVRTGFDGNKLIAAGGIGQGSSRTTEIRIQRC